MSSEGMTIFWFRRDLRLRDNIGLEAALGEGSELLALFIFDPLILDRLEDHQDPRVAFIHERIHHLDEELRAKGAGLMVLHEEPEGAFRTLSEELPLTNVHCNRDHEPYAKDRDERVRKVLEREGIGFHSHDDQNLFPPERVLKKDGTPYKVFTPFARKANSLFHPSELEAASSIPSRSRSADYSFPRIPSLGELGFSPSSIPVPPSEPDEGLISNYDTDRDRPAEKGTTRLGVHLRFGTISIRELARYGRQLNETFFNELIWRDFFQMILHFFPHVVDRSFKPEFDRIRWINDENAFEAWCEGRTGYPMVDAGMRELKATGYMHNRCRMVTASFLTKHLLTDWRWGEHWFARKLLDYELASNNGNWQWAAGCGCDAAPYFRVFNPTRQLERFDPDRRYVKEWVPELGTREYPEPIVEHGHARERALRTFKEALG